MTPTVFFSFWANFGAHSQDKMRQFWLATNERNVFKCMLVNEGVPIFIVFGAQYLSGAIERGTSSICLE